MTQTPYRQGEKPLHEYLRQHARAHPRKPAFIWYGKEISYAELDSLSDTFASRLHALGVRKGDRISLFLQNCPQYVIAHVGIQKLGAIVNPCSPLFKSHELQYQLSDVGAQVIVAADDLYPLVESVREQTSLRHVFLTNYGDFLPEQPSIDVPPELRQPRRIPSECMDFTQALAQHEAAPPVDLALDDVSLMSYTSGTTGLPKGAMLTYRNALFKSYAAADQNWVREDEVCMVASPIYHIAGMLLGINLTLYTGATMVLLFRFDPIQAVQAIERHRVTWWYSGGIMNVTIMNTPGADRYDLSSLRLNPATSFGVILTQALADQWKAYTGGCALFEATYGMTETHTWDTSMPADDVHWGAHGKPVPGVEARIVDPQTGDELPAGQSGELIVRSDGNFKGYWNRPDATASTLRDGWVHTGDVVKRNEDGYLVFQGRFKEMIKVSGYSVFPEEVEAILIKHPAVKQAAVIGVPDPTKGEVIKAVLVPQPDAAPATESELIAWCRENMSAYKVPRHIEWRDALPATGTGKVLRRMLKEEPKTA